VHLKVNQVRKPGRTYQYAQLVQSVRDERGKPTAQQRTLLKAMGLGHLARDREIAPLIRPR